MKAAGGSGCLAAVCQSMSRTLAEAAPPALCVRVARPHSLASSGKGVSRFFSAWQCRLLAVLLGGNGEEAKPTVKNELEDGSYYKH